MKSLLRDPLFCGVVTLQLAAFSLIYGAGWETVSRWTPSSIRGGARFEAGHPLPSLATYDQRGQRQPLLIGGNGSRRHQSTCSCDDNKVSSWLEAVHAGGEESALVLPLERGEAQEVQQRLRWTGRVLRCALKSFSDLV
jgi:hypothetical protein